MLHTECSATTHLSPLQYCFANSTNVITFDKYFLDDDKIINKKGQLLSYFKSTRGDYRCGVYINGVKKKITVARAILTTLVGPPPTKSHTADHIDRNPENNTIDNLRWASKSEQRDNQMRPKTQKNAFIIIKNGYERTANEWAEELGCHFCTILRYAQNKTNGFSYKEYPDIFGEVWTKIEGSKNSKGRWEVSNMKRAKYITNNASIVYDKFVLRKGYPSIRVNGKQNDIHTLTFKAFNPNIVIGKGEVVRHLDDNKKNFALGNLDIGTISQNSIDAHNNGKYDGTKSARRPVTSYVNGVKEQDFDSLVDAVKYLKMNGYPRARASHISTFSNTTSIRYGRTWKSL